MAKGRLLLIFGLFIMAVGGIIYLFAKGDNTATAGKSEYAGSIVINEVMPSNDGSVPDENGEYNDWLELYNKGNSAIDISGWGLSDSKLSPAKWTFPSGTVIESGGYLVIFCSGTDKNSTTHATFKLNARKDDLLLTDGNGDTVDSILLFNVQNGHTLGRKIDNIDKFAEFSMPSPGYPNDDAGAKAFQKAIKGEQTGVYINEFMASNRSTIADDTGKYSDWIELYNSTDQAVNLKGYSLSDDVTTPSKWVFPDVTIEAKGYLVIFCSGDVASANATKLHADFALSSYNEAVVFTSPLGKIIDSIEFTEQSTDESYGRNAQDITKWGKMSKPTPGFANTDAGYSEFQKSLG